MDEMEAVRQRVREALIGEPPEPWTPMGLAPITGITEVGFAEDSELLLVLSGQSREIIDCATGKIVARDKTTEHRSSWYGPHDLIGMGFGPLNGRRIALAGASGGGLPVFTRDGWGAVRLPIDWPDEYLVLMAPFHSIYQPAAPFWKMGVAREPTAWGFSFTGNSLIAATTEGVSVFVRGR
jgi:hypothetical protein